MTFVEKIKTRRVAFKAEEKTQIETAQVQCPHNNVLHWGGNTHYGSYNPERVCTECGLHEKGSWWSSLTQWRCNDGRGPHFDTTKLPNREGRTVIETHDSNDISHFKL